MPDVSGGEGRAGRLDSPVRSDPGTARLALARPVATDVAELFAMYRDPRVWRDDPALRRSEVSEVEAWLQRQSRRWDRDGIGLWVLRPLEGPLAGELIGIGGCSLRDGLAWNLAFTLRPVAWGNGYAQEVAAEGIRRARCMRPGLPITAVVAASNPRSARAVRRAGLHPVWQGSDRHGCEPAATITLYADRPLTVEQVRDLTA